VLYSDKVLSSDQGHNFTTKSGDDMGRGDARPAGRSWRSAGPRVGWDSWGGAHPRRSAVSSPSGVWAEPWHKFIFLKWWWQSPPHSKVVVSCHHRHIQSYAYGSHMELLPLLNN